MYIDSQLTMFWVAWTEHTRHTYERVSRSKWRIKLNSACGAEMFLENQPDDLRRWATADGGLVDP